MDGKDSESRFSMLLKPIRELADNWNIDIAAELEEYLEDLESVVISFDGGKSNLNFAEAALMIQGSAVVYSKKVEFLYNLVYETLDLLSKQKKQRGEGSKDKNHAHLVVDDPVVVLDRSVFGEFGNIDLKPDDKEMQRRKAISSNLNRYSFLRLYESNMGVIISNLSRDNKDKSLLLSRCHIGPAGQFTIGTSSNPLQGSNTSHISTSFLFDHEEEASGAMEVEENPSTDKPTSSNDTNENHAMNAASNPVVSPNASKSTSIPNESNLLNNSIAEPPIEAIPSISDDDDDFSDFIPSQAAPSRRVSLVNDVWRLEDPYDSHENRSIPYKRGNILLSKEQIQRRLKNTKQRKEAERKSSKAKEKDSLFVYPSSNLSVFNHLQSCVKEALRKQIVSYRTINTRAQTATMLSVLEEPSDNEIDAGDSLSFDNELEPNLVDEATIQQELEQTRLDVSVRRGDNYMASITNLLNQTTPFDPLQLGESRLGETNQTMVTTIDGNYVSYEDLCRQHMDAFMHGVEKFTRETKLGKRVTEWETKIIPVLEEQDRREEFDIHKNREELIDELRMKTDKEASVAELAKQRKPYEVSRMFVSLLQMANDGTVALKGSGFCNDVDIQLIN